LNKELWAQKGSGVQTEIVSRLLLWSPGIKSHSDVGATNKQKEYYVGEGVGFPRVWAMVSLMSPGSFVAYLSIKGAPENAGLNK
jgi:hypothetical protein